MHLERHSPPANRSASESEFVRAFDHILLLWKIHDDISNGSSYRFDKRTQTHTYKQTLLKTIRRLAVWLSGNALASINVVALRQTRLVPGWVTVDKSSTNLGNLPGRVADNTVWSHWQVASRSAEVNFTKRTIRSFTFYLRCRPTYHCAGGNEWRADGVLCNV